MFKVGVVSDKNARFRRTMEDAHIALVAFNGDPTKGFFAVLDGHGGSQAATFCETALAENFRQALDAHPNVPEAINHSFKLTDEGLKASAIIYPGCTCVVAYVREEPDKTFSLFTGNVGDARAVLNRNGQAIRLSYDHKALDPHERQRITDTGGFIIRDRVNGTLAITRALGDIPMKEFVISHPYTTETQLSKSDTRLILACDGIWDVMSDQEALDFIKATEDAQTASEQLLKEALRRGTTDNLTVMIVDILYEAVPSSASTTATSSEAPSAANSQNAQS